MLLDFLFRASLALRRVPVRQGLKAGHEGGLGWSIDGTRNDPPKGVQHGGL